MERGLTGHYVDSITGGVRCQAFIPDPLPPLAGSAGLLLDALFQ